MALQRRKKIEKKNESKKKTLTFEEGNMGHARVCGKLIV